MFNKRNKNYMCGIFAIFVSIIFIGHVNAAEYENYFGIKMTNEEYNTLINLGFTADEIYYMNEETYEENKNLDANLASATNKYYKTIYNDLSGNPQVIEVSKEEFENQSVLNTRATITTEYKQMVTSISENGSKFRYKVTLLWRNMPSIKSYDIIGIGFNDRVKIDSSVYFNYHWCNSSGACQTESYYYDKKSTSSGGSAVYDLPNNPVALSATLYYDVVKDTTNTITRLEMCGDYAHAIENVSVNSISNHDIGRAGIELGSNLIDSYDAIPCAVSTWTGSW